MPPPPGGAPGGCRAAVGPKAGAGGAVAPKAGAAEAGVAKLTVFACIVVLAAAGAAGAAGAGSKVGGAAPRTPYQMDELLGSDDEDEDDLMMN